MLIGSRPLDPSGHDLLPRDLIGRAGASRHGVAAMALARRRYWDFDTRRTLRFATFDEYVDAFREHFVEAVKRRVRSAYPVAISVSGGLDSSSVFCQAETLRRSGTVTAPSLAGVSYVSERRETDEQRLSLRHRGALRRHDSTRFSIEPLTGLVNGAEQQVAAIEAPFVDYMSGCHQRALTRARQPAARDRCCRATGAIRCCSRRRT